MYNEKSKVNTSEKVLASVSTPQSITIMHSVHKMVTFGTVKLDFICFFRVSRLIRDYPSGSGQDDSNGVTLQRGLNEPVCD